eukprot:CAMPEP_0172492520 /NCGR_PEP_ID=MMETSP1066-20121228/23706_1 /TAXON_ID=671091 /ORGANISM="Coscinodiscus wailesii, Strain CCMP2513" /LENGTH=177 /DNA_ID=CAMNT_0013262197 /DNA_START=581 /DNA_END=1114 /DNA_ORIENTATION=+
MKQAIMYIFSFLLTYSFTVAHLIYIGVRGESSITLAILESMFLPLQGFNNFLIYARPIINRNRIENPGKSYFWAFRKMLRDSNNPSHQRRREKSIELAKAPLNKLFKDHPGINRHLSPSIASAITGSKIAKNTVKAGNELEEKSCVRASRSGKNKEKTSHKEKDNEDKQSQFDGIEV